jgi:hypothetical protein
MLRCDAFRGIMRRITMRAALGTLLSVSLLLSACASDPSLYVHRMRLGKKATRESGETLKVQRPDQERFGTAQPGFFALKSKEEWDHFWEGTGSIPDPPKVDYERKMILVAVTESAQSQALRIGEVIETGTGVHAYVSETRPGEGCPLRTQGTSKQDFVIVDHSTKPVHFHVEPAQAGSCGDAPTAKVTCTVAAQGQAPGAGRAHAEGVGEILAMPGETVECEARQEVRGVFAAVDRRWSFTEFPKGSNSKLLFDPNGMRVRFTVDTFGRYGVRFEIMDDAGRKGEGAAAIVASPSKDGLYLRLGWGGFETGDDPDTFPRVALESIGPNNVTCNVDSPPNPPWCDARRQGQNIQLKFGNPDGSYPTTVKYVDDRFAGAPMVCLKVFLNGVQTTDVCDKEVRKAGEVWKVGALVAKSGLFEAKTDDAKDPVKPPATGGTKPPATGGTKPPATGGTKPPATGGTKPPVTGGTKPPAGGKKPGAGIFNP